jgi:hypothetical protein
VQGLAWWTRPVPFLERARARYGKRFTIRLPAAPPFVILSEPETIKEVYSAPADVLHPGEGAKLLEPIVGRHSLILLDENAHLEQRKLLLPAFHGERMGRLAGLMEEVAEREVASWPRGEPFATHPRLQGLTLDIILRAVFGIAEGPRFDELRAALNALLAFGEKPYSMLPPPQRGLFPGSPADRFIRARKRADGLIFDLIAERRARDGEAEGDDVLAMLLAARHDDGSPMSEQELHDELMTLLVAGHETTASELAWAFERLAREPGVLARLVEEIDSGDGDAYLTATIQETLRRRPVLPNSEPRLVKRPVEIGGWTYPTDVSLVANAYLVHHDPDIYPDPYAFRPERFLEEPPGTYTWIPFGGGRRRCIGASFATLEMKIALRAVLRACRIEPGGAAHELTRRRQITVSPRRGAPMVLRDREPVTTTPPEPAAVG